MLRRLNVSEDAWDVVVVGSGAGGGAAAWALAQAGVRVLVLEAGPRFDPAVDYPLAKDDWELHNFPTPAGSTGRYTFGEMQPLATRYRDLRSWDHLRGRLVRGNRRARGTYHHVRGVGGSTLRYSGEAHRMNPAAMSMHSDFGVAADWPLNYADLDADYCTAEETIGVAGQATDALRPRGRPLPMPAHPFSFASQQLAAGCRELGLHWQPNSLAILSRPWRGRPPCNYCGNCGRGCSRLDKGTVDLTFIREAEATGRCTIRTGTVVTGIETGSNDRVTALICRRADGASERVHARTVVLAAGAVETPRLLLNAASPGSPQGLANESGQVGRNFMETLLWSSVGMHPQALGSHRGLPVDGICWDFNTPGTIPGVIGGARFSISTAEVDLLGPLAYATRVVPGWGRDHKRRMRAEFGRALGVAAVGESLPNAGTFIDLDPDTTDDHGQPLARISSFLPDTEIRRLRFMAETSRKILTASGVSRIIEEFGSYDIFNSTHVFGTCRMGVSADDSVVDPWGRSHRWRNLYIADASVFPSSGGGESPALTINALALRTARQLTEDLARRA